MSGVTAEQLLVDAGMLTRCRHRIHLERNGLGAVVDLPEDPGVRQRREAAALHRQRVFESLSELGEWAVPSGPERAAQTLAACREGAELIWGAAFPIDADAGRRGGVEILWRQGGGYIPIIVVNHRITDLRPEASAESLVVTSPLDQWSPTADPSRRARSHLRDQLRLAHIHRMLSELELASGEPVGGAIGLDADCILVHDLTGPLEEYDRRLADRLGILAGTVETAPSRVPECRSCPWWSSCEAELAARGDVSIVAAGSRADVLRAVGVNTVDQLAGWVGAAPEEWQHGDFGDTVVAAQAWLAGADLVRRVPMVRVRRADVEVDVDLESYQERGAYLWGTLLDGEYRPFGTWDPLPTADEGRAFGEFWTWLMQVRDAAVAAGKTFAAYCYSRSAEDKWLLDSARRFPGIPGVPTEAEIRAFIDSPQWVDIYQAINEQFICPNGKGLKKIAPIAGFNWRDAEASGEASMTWYRHAVGMDGEIDLTQRTRILEYNEDDVRATAVLRQWMTETANDAVPDADSMRHQFEMGSVAGQWRQAP
ncbi:TM0106 family RecB-like putative nuclease [Smaragdicoccus niigatensis]|uniref:TM0106 family RecB-like putative nuclease n=1 Tax=Smaragdicoccus niigatensis TaxID=359359 RepID=UPI000377FC2C